MKARWLAVLSTLLLIPTPAAAAPAATDYQAENATISKGVVESNHAGYTGTGFVNYDNVTGSYLQFAVSAASAGPASLTFRFANGTTTDRPMTITVNGTTVATARSFPGTGAWTTWQDAVVNATLAAGSNTIRATATTANGGPNLDRLQVGAPSDTEHPTAPGQPVCSDITFNALTLSFPASTDNVGVVAYDIYNQGQKIAEAPNPPGSPYRLTGLRPNAQYELSVFGRDAAGNVSATSPEAICTTTADPGDPNPPSAPGQPTVTGVNQTGATVSWPASTDDRGVTQYDVRSANNAVLDSVTGTPPATSKTLSTLACNTAYTIHVVAKDAAGNTSAKSPTASFTTGACEGGNNPATPTQVSTGWSIPWDIAWAPDGSFALVTERDSFKVFKINRNGSGKTQVGTVPNAVTTDGEGGLMGVAFSPTWNGGSDQQVFFMHTASEGNRVAQMNFNGTALSGYGTILSGMRKSRYHNGGRIRFGPDGFLYVAIGDSQQGNLAQDKNALNGKILRITKTGAAAPGNPFGTAVYSYGHRNPQGLAWDSAGRLWSSELGDSTSDELNLIQPGKNYGWPTCEGSCSTAGMTNPKKTWSVSSASPSGLAYANGALFMAALRGQRMWRITLNGENVGTVTSHWNGTYGRLRAVAKVPGENAIWFTTTNADNNGGQPDGSDKILRSNLTTGRTAATAARSTDWSVAMVDSTMARYTPSSLGGWSYTNGLYLYGQYLVYQRTHNPKYLAYIKSWVDRFVDSSGNIDNSFGNLDSMLSGRLLVILHHETGQERYKIAATKIRNRLKTYPRTADGGFWHATSRQHQLWGDGVFMVNPFLAEYGREFGDSAYTNKETVDQLLTYASHLQRSTGLLRHAYDESHTQSWADPSTGQSPEVWCRAEGWYGMAAIDVLEVIPANQPHRAELLQVLAKLIAAYKTYQDPATGRWFQVVDKGGRSDNWTETSCSSMYTFVISRAVQRGYVDASYNAVAQRGYQGVLAKLSLGSDARTNLKDISIGTNVGDYAYYIARDRATNDRHGLGAFLIMNEQLH
ncbi:glycoside hydrolase family 88 protein [Kribbella sp. NPDC051718]|uniref:glycoside hydrolase family 88 protein n=1 Tax=Kribbella sp. NPDC051718 TaxID=3155168 RepID=UPI003413F9B9